MARSVLQILPEDVAGAHEAHSYFADIPIFLLREQTVQSAIDRALAGATRKANKSGAALTVLLPEIDVEHPNVPGPKLEVIQRVRVQEIPLINLGSGGTGKTAEQICEASMEVVQFMSGVGCYSDLHPVKEFVTPRFDLGPVTYELAWRCTVGRSEAVRVAMPTIVVEGTTVTLACATPGAAIYWTMDDSYPWAGNGEAEVYAGPFDWTEVEIGGFPLRVCAHVGSLASSDVNREEMA